MAVAVPLRRIHQVGPPAVSQSVVDGGAEARGGASMPDVQVSAPQVSPQGLFQARFPPLRTTYHGHWNWKDLTAIVCLVVYTGLLVLVTYLRC